VLIINKVYPCFYGAIKILRDVENGNFTYSTSNHFNYIGLCLITLDLWELREGVNRNQYIKYMFTGLFLLIILSPMIWRLVTFSSLAVNY
jgi:uncharacterized membrane protein